MCGRYTQHHTTDQVVMRFDVGKVVNETSPRYNAAPTQRLPVIIRASGERVLDAFQWGLIPSWAKDASIGSKMLNARGESVAEKPSFRNALKRRRCLVPADGYYEWQRLDKVKQPIYYQLAKDGLFAFAGLWEEWRPEGAPPLRTFTILTTTPNELAARAHDRMPVILRPDDEAEWLAEEPLDPGTLHAILHPHSAAEMHAYRVSTRVNSAHSDDADLTVSIDNHDMSDTLFADKSI